MVRVSIQMESVPTLNTHLLSEFVQVVPKVSGQILVQRLKYCLLSWYVDMCVEIVAEGSLERMMMTKMISRNARLVSSIFKCLLS